MKDKKRGIIYALIAILFFGTLGTAFKIIFKSLDSFSATVHIGILTTLILLILILIQGKAKKIIPEFKSHAWFFIIAGIIGLGIQQITYLMSYSLMTVSQTVIMFYLYPLLMILIASIFFKEKASWKSWIFVLIGFIGVYVVVSKGTLIQININLGIILVLVAAISWALFSVLIKHKKFDVEIGMFFFNLFGVLSLFLLLPIYPLNIHLAISEILGLIYVALFPTAIAFVLYNKALKLIPTSLASNLLLLVPITSIILASIVLGEKIIFYQIIGLILILGSIFLNLNYGKNN